MPNASIRRRVLEEELARILPLIIDVGVSKVILFGSLAEDALRSASDLDLMLVKETDERFVDRLSELYETIQPRVAIDLLVYTPIEFRRLQRESSFVRHAVATGKILYEKNA